MSTTRVLLIGGPSHAGKSTLAELIAERLGWTHVSTDWLARHPGRPWAVDGRPVPDHVAEHYGGLAVHELVADVLRHYDGMWPMIEGIIRTHVLDETSDCLVFEGSALLPDRFADAGLDGVAACWLTADSDVLRARIHESSAYATLAANERFLVDKFVGRNDGFDGTVMDDVRSRGLTAVDTDDAISMADLADRCQSLVRD